MLQGWAGQCVPHVGKNSGARDPSQLDAILLTSNASSKLILRDYSEPFRGLITNQRVIFVARTGSKSTLISGY